MLSDARTDEGGTTSRLTPGEWFSIGVGSGLLGGIALAVPIVIWDAVSDGHLTFELPMAATAWVFGLEHFSNTQYLAWPLVIGIGLLVVYTALSGLVFTALADRVFRVTGPLASLAAGLAWSFVSFIFFWDMLLPIARDGAPFRGQPFVAPNWTWILGFTLLGVVTGVSYGALRPSPARAGMRQRREAHSPLPRAA